MAILVRWIGFDAEVVPKKVYNGDEIGKEGAIVEDLLEGNLKTY